MAYTTTELITRAFYLSGVVAEELETVDGAQMNQGLNLFNALLAIKTANQRLIPYYSDYVFTAVIGQESYLIPNLILAETLTFTIGTVRYAMTLKTRSEYFATPRANDVQSLPYQYHIERNFGGSKLWMYYLPNEAYEFNLHGKFSLLPVSLGQDLSLTFDAFYIEYFRYALTEYICAEYNITMQPQDATKLNEYESIIFDISPIDFTIKKVSALHKSVSHADIYAQANIGQGWWPG
jgi:hypothetical protein